MEDTKEMEGISNLQIQWSTNSQLLYKKPHDQQPSSIWLQFWNTQACLENKFSIMQTKRCHSPVRTFALSRMCETWQWKQNVTGSTII